MHETSERRTALGMNGNLPTYASLPIDSSKPAHSAWGVFGVDDEVGTINLLTPEHVRRAATLVHRGRVVSLNWDLEMPRPPILGRRALQHTITDLAPVSYTHLTLPTKRIV